MNIETEGDFSAIAEEMRDVIGMLEDEAAMLLSDNESAVRKLVTLRFTVKQTISFCEKIISLQNAVFPKETIKQWESIISTFEKTILQ